MNKILAEYTREELERKILHMTAFLAHKIATEYIELTEPLAKRTRTPEADLENTHRILEHIVCVWPAWDIVEKTHPGYELMKEWVQKNNDNSLEKPCICDGCKPHSEMN